MAPARAKKDGDLPRDLDVDAFLAWARQQSGRYELHDGEVVAMAPERVGHARVKGAVFLALKSAIDRAGVDCRAVPDGVAVHVSDRKWYQPDTIVYCDRDVADDDINIVNPIILVEVSSPSTIRLDETVKLAGYFSLPSVHHYLLVNPGGPPVVHHQRQADGTILTRILGEGSLRLDPPGLDFEIVELFS